MVAVQNPQGKTRLEIATVPLDSGARPTLGEPSRGRIYADVNGFLDPVDFRGQLVTVVGPITGAVDGKIGNTPYKFMVMQVTGYKRWHLTQQVIMPPQPIDPWSVSYTHLGSVMVARNCSARSRIMACEVQSIKQRPLLASMIIEANNGRCFMLCTSHAMMRDLAEQFRATMTLPRCV